MCVAAWLLGEKRVFDVFARAFDAFFQLQVSLSATFQVNNHNSGIAERLKQSDGGRQHEILQHEQRTTKSVSLCGCPARKAFRLEGVTHLRWIVFAFFPFVFILFWTKEMIFCKISAIFQRLKFDSRKLSHEEVPPRRKPIC